MTRVIKVGGRPQSDPLLPGIIAAASRVRGGLVVVHGGGDEVSTLQGALGGSTKFVNGRRVTTSKDIDIVRMALSGSANKRLVASFVDCGVNAVGISGEDAGLIAALPMDPEQLGFVGSPGRINVAFLRFLLSGGYTPVISPVSRDASGSLGIALNVNGDDAAAAIAVSVDAEELLLVSDVEGVMSDGALVRSLSAIEATGLIVNGTAAGGMQAKLQAGLAALEGGVMRVRISDIRAIDDLSRGTVLRSTGGE
ncbi:MAG TPA: acetylglutamate kinase [Gemmatimonadaceae bacterium]|nr:acetylglutamate kinase [Gemmatimonadaceae bacterium]